MPFEEGSWDGTCDGVERLVLSPSSRCLEEERRMEAAHEHEEAVGLRQASNHQVPSDNDP